MELWPIKQVNRKARRKKRSDRWAFSAGSLQCLIGHGTRNSKYIPHIMCAKRFHFDAKWTSDRLWSSAWLDTQNMKKSRKAKEKTVANVCYVFVFVARKLRIQYGQLLCSSSESDKCVRASMMWYHIPLLVICLSSCCHLWNGTRDYPYTQSSLKLNTPFSWNDTRDSISLVRMLCW